MTDHPRVRILSSDGARLQSHRRVPRHPAAMEVFGAPLSEADAKAITECLATTYGSPK